MYQMNTYTLNFYNVECQSFLNLKKKKSHTKDDTKNNWAL